MTGPTHVQVAPPPVELGDPAEVPDQLERYLTTLALTQSGGAVFDIHVCPAATRALRDRLRQGREWRELKRQAEVHLAHVRIENDRSRRDDIRRAIWFLATTAVMTAWIGLT